MNEDTQNNSPASKKATAPDQTGKAEPHPPISTRRLWLFRIIAVVVTPVLAMMLLEVVLRVVGFGYPAATFVRDEVKGRPVYCCNNRFGWRFFPGELSSGLEPFVVTADKADNTYRIFILGESAAQGAPDPAYRFGKMLRIMLRQQYPSVNFEVFTAAMPAINSHVIFQIAKDCARLQPDLFIVYAGNNEVTGPYGAGTVFDPLSKSLFLIRLGIATKTTRLGQLMTSLVGTVGGKPKTWNGREMFPGKQIRHDDKQMRYVYSHFRHNLEDITLAAQKAATKTIISTVAVNLKDCPPFASLNRAGLNEQQKKSFDGLYQKGIEFEKAGDFNGACKNYLAAAEIDDTYAELQFRLGRCQWNLEQFDKARESYASALELDALRLRTDSSINRIIREVSAGKADKGIYLVDAAGVFEQNSPHNCPGFEFFLEHVHLNFSGNYLLARTIFDKVKEILPDRIKNQKAEAQGVPSEDACAELLAFTNYDNLRITQQNFKNISEREPFVNQAYHDEITDIWRQKTEELKSTISADARVKALGQYEKAIKLNGAGRFLRLNYALLLLEDKRNAPAAITQYDLIVKEIPNDHRVLATLASIEVALGDIDSALKHATRAIEIMPTDSTGNYAAGMGYQMKGRYKEAQRYLAEAIRLTPKFVYPYIRLGQIYSQQGKNEQAERVYRKGIEAIPDNPILYLELALLLRKQGLWQEADIEQQKAIALAPNISTRPWLAPPTQMP
ncbi:MAG: tetratricopeptide repeat protein [Sedimentisphaerales bacterium]|nr:tetratricopeptide repeat protein [Sedimentisphaerales bacterium]